MLERSKYYWLWTFCFRVWLWPAVPCTGLSVVVQLTDPWASMVLQIVVRHLIMNPTTTWRDYCPCVLSSVSASAADGPESEWELEQWKVLLVIAGLSGLYSGVYTWFKILVTVLWRNTAEYTWLESWRVIRRNLRVQIDSGLVAKSSLAPYLDNRKCTIVSTSLMIHLECKTHLLIISGTK